MSLKLLISVPYTHLAKVSTDLSNEVKYDVGEKGRMRLRIVDVFGHTKVLEVFASRSWELDILVNKEESLQILLLYVGKLNYNQKCEKERKSRD